MLPTPVFLGFPGDSAGKESTCHVGDLGSISGLGRSPGEGKGCPLQDSGLENSMDCIVHGVAKSQTRLSDFLFHFQSSLVGFPGVTSGKEPTCQRRRCEFDPWVGKIAWRRQWQSTLIFLLGNPMDREVWRATVRGSQKSQTQ